MNVMPDPDPGLSLQVDSRGLSLYLINGAPGNRTNVYRLDDLDDLPRLSERDRAMVMGLLEEITSKLAVQQSGASE